MNMRIMSIVAVMLLVGCATQRGFPARDQINNFSQVDAHVFRGAQPPYSAFADLAAMGVKAVVNLREPGDGPPDEEFWVTKAGMKYISLPMSGISAPTEARLHEILSVIAAVVGPVFVHCQFGCDRTGIVCGGWRVAYDGWTGEKALQEAVAFGMSDLLPNFRHRLKTFKK
jgi:protein tyrosine phosphatase (PTP) superfamily phosphohydrolase (DUF442 family)